MYFDDAHRHYPSSEGVQFTYSVASLNIRSAASAMSRHSLAAISSANSAAFFASSRRIGTTSGPWRSRISRAARAIISTVPDIIGKRLTRVVRSGDSASASAELYIATTRPFPLIRAGLSRTSEKRL